MTDNALRPRPSQLDGREDESARLPSFTAPLAALAFWSAIGLPALYLPLLVAGLGTPGDLVAFLCLFGLHLVALVAGQSYRNAE